MSLRVTSKVWDKAPYKRGMLLALLAMADWADDDGVCWPKIEQLKKKSRLTESGVQLCLRKFQEDGVIRVIKESKGPGKPRIYQLSEEYQRGLATEPINQGKGLTSREKGLTSTHANKERLSLNATVNKPSNCKTCNSQGVLRQLPRIPGPRLIPCPHCSNSRIASSVGSAMNQ
jgi:hypothetical protein